MAIDFWRFVPGYMFQNSPRDDAWDAILNEALDLFDPENVNAHECNVGPFVVWIANWPYDYGTSLGTGLPTVATRKRLRKAVHDARVAELRKTAELMNRKPVGEPVA